MCGVTTRTIRRDLDALQEAGFPLYDEKVDGHTWWKLSGHAFKGLSETGFTLSELCAFYFSRTILEALAGAPFSADLKTGFDKLSGALTPRMRQFFDKLPSVLAAKAEAKKRRPTSHAPDHVTRLVEAILSRRQVQMRYHSFSSGRVKDYMVDPQRLVFAQGALYLFAYVPGLRAGPHVCRASHQVAERPRGALRPDRDPARQAFSQLDRGPHGRARGRRDRIRAQRRPIRPRARVPPVTADRRPPGRLDRALAERVRRLGASEWILSFGPFARVIRPVSLAARVLDEIEEAREQYIPHGEFEPAPRLWESSDQRAFPFHEAAHEAV